VATGRGADASSCAGSAASVLGRYGTRMMVTVRLPRRTERPGGSVARPSPRILARLFGWAVSSKGTCPRGSDDVTGTEIVLKE
jgi:hypothetical protein